MEEQITEEEVHAVSDLAESPVPLQMASGNVGPESLQSMSHKAHLREG